MIERRALRLGCLLLALTACGSSPAGRPPAPTSRSPITAGELSALATQTRTDAVTTDLFRITLTNRSDRPLTVTSVALDSPGFDPVPASVREDPFPPGVTYDLPARYGSARCGTSPLPALAVVQAHADHDPPTTLRLPLASTDGLLERLQDHTCRQASIEREVQLAVVDLAAAGPGALRGSLRIERGAAKGPIRLTQLRDSVMFALQVRLPATLEPGAQRLDLPLAVRPAGCSGHLIGETKQPYLFPAFLSLSGMQAQLDLPTTKGQHELLQRLVRTACPGGGS